MNLDALFTRKGFFLQAAIVNILFLSYYILYLFRGDVNQPFLTIPLHAVIILVLFVVPGFLAATVIRRSYNDILHLAVYMSVLSSVSVLCLKLLINMLRIPVTATSLAISIAAYCNICLALQLLRQRGGGGKPVSGNRISRASFRMGVAVIAILCILFVVMELVSLKLPAIPDVDFVNFGTYNIMTKSVPGAGYYEESHSKIYPDYTPYLLYDFSHPPLVTFNNAYAATLGGYMRYSEILHRRWMDYVHSGSADYDYVKLGLDQGYLACNRAPTNYHIVLLCALIYLFTFRLTGNRWISFIGMLSVIWIFWNIIIYAVVWLMAYKAVFVFYSLLILYCYIYFEKDRRFAFMLALYGSLVSQKVAYAILAVCIVDAIRYKWRVFKNPFLLGFLAGTLAFIAYGLAIDRKVFISHYFIRHMYDRLVILPGLSLAVKRQWIGFLYKVVGIWTFAAMVYLSAVFAVTNRKCRTIVLFIYFVSCALIGSKIWPHVPRFLVPMVLPLVLMSCASVTRIIYGLSDAFKKRKI